jgi:hypothetical protein
MNNLFDNLFPPTPDDGPMPPNPLLTGYECNRCGSANAIRISITVDKDLLNRNVFKDYDLCYQCILAMNSFLLSKLSMKKRELWLENFQRGILGE